MGVLGARDRKGIESEIRGDRLLGWWGGGFGKGGGEGRLWTLFQIDLVSSMKIVDIDACR